eukprot:g67814.t1
MATYSDNNSAGESRNRQQQQRTGNAQVVFPSPGAIRTREVNGKMLTFKFCGTCKIWKPPRASHCQYCDNCVKEFDHHCPFVNNCIGQRNYGAFVLFNLTIVCLLVSVMISTFSALDDRGEKATESSTAIALILVVVFSLVMFGIMIFFFGFHCFLILTGQTTREQVKSWRSSEQSGFTNDDTSERTLACLRRPPSLLRPRMWVDPTDQPGETGSDVNISNVSESSQHGDEQALLASEHTHEGERANTSKVNMHLSSSYGDSS